MLIMLLAVGLLVAGLYALLRPEKIQAYAVRSSAKWNPYLPWMKAPSYVWSVRLMGGIAILMATVTLGMVIADLFQRTE